MSETSVSVGRVYHETHGHVLKIVIDNAVSAILKPFVSTDDAVAFEPRNPEDEEPAKQATEYVNYVLNVDNPGFILLQFTPRVALITAITARGVAENQIDLMNFQHTDRDEKPRYYCPDVLVETYAAELRKHLPEALITINASEYVTVHGHVCAAHSVNAMKRIGARAPAFIQETNERLFKNDDGTPNVVKINRLRRAFAESLSQTLQSLQESQRVTMIDLHRDAPVTRVDHGPAGQIHLPAVGDQRRSNAFAGSPTCASDDRDPLV